MGMLIFGAPSMDTRLSFNDFLRELLCLKMGARDEGIAVFSKKAAHARRFSSCGRNFG